jgi:hydrogenase maturation protease
VKPARVIGVGSPYGADRIGWEVVDELARSGGMPPERVAFTRCARPDGELLAALERPGLVLLIDAMRSGASPGTVRRVRAEELMRDGTLISSHSFGINSALSLAAALGSLAAEVQICGIEIPPETAPDAVAPAPLTAAEREEMLSEIRKILMGSLREHGYL